MKIDTYKIHLETELSKLEKPWLNGDEGYIYVGLIKPNKNDYSHMRSDNNGSCNLWNH